MHLSHHICSPLHPHSTHTPPTLHPQTLTGISTLLDRADQVYKLLVQHRNELDQILISLASGTVLTSQKVLLTSGDTGVNRGIQLVAQRYCVDCKTTYHELSKIIQVLLNVMSPRTTIFSGQ